MEGAKSWRFVEAIKFLRVLRVRRFVDVEYVVDCNLLEGMRF